MTFLGVIQGVSSVVILALCCLGLAGAYTLVKDEHIVLDRTDYCIIGALTCGAAASIINLIV